MATEAFVFMEIESPVIPEYKEGEQYPFQYRCGDNTVTWIDEEHTLHRWIETLFEYGQLI